MAVADTWQERCLDTFRRRRHESAGILQESPVSLEGHSQDTVIGSRHAATGVKQSITSDVALDVTLVRDSPFSAARDIQLELDGNHLK